MQRDSFSLSMIDVMEMMKFKLDLDKSREWDAEANIKVNAIDNELSRRFDQLVLGLISGDDADELIGRMMEHGAVFGGYEVLKVIFPSCETQGTPRQRRVFTLFTPLGHSGPFIEFFTRHGYFRTHVDDNNMELNAVHYDETARSCLNFCSISRGVFLDIIESSGEVPFYPILRMATTYLMHCMSPTTVFAPYASLTCRNQGVINTHHTTDDYGTAIPVDIHLLLEMLRFNCKVKLHFNPSKFSDNSHKGCCGLHANCLSTLRSTASQPEGSVLYTFRGKKNTSGASGALFRTDGLVWRLGGWACYETGPCGLRTYLVEAPGLHEIYDGEIAGKANGLVDNRILRDIIGWS